MRICLVAHGFPPEERTGVEVYTEALAVRFAELGHDVEVFVPCPNPRLADLAMRRVLGRTPGGARYGITRIANNQGPRSPEEALDPPGLAARFGEFLDREHPDVIHFHHVIKLGLGLVEEAAARGIPTAFTAHDYYGLCHRYTLLRPDLTICTKEGDPVACARCDLALSILNEVSGGADYQMGLSPGDLDDATARRLIGTLEGDPVADAGFAATEWSLARERRAKLDERRREVFASFDLRLAPSAFVAERLSRSLGGAEVEHLPNGIDCEDLIGLPPVPVGAKGEPLRVAYLGGLGKQKGVGVLLDAFELFEAQHPGAATLAVHGYSTDAAWVDRLRARADEVGADWHGGFARADLPDILAGVDLIVVPSTWYENYPIVIREALAAGRPVIASRLGALSESVRDGVDGALFEAGSPSDLARVLGEVVEDPDQLRRWAAAIQPVHTMAMQAEELLERYEVLITKGAIARDLAGDLEALPESMRGFVAGLNNYERMPTRELLARVATGLGELGAELGLDAKELGADRVLARAFAGGDAAQDHLRDARREADWLRGSVAAQTESNTELQQKLAWLEEQLAGREAGLAAKDAELAEARGAAAAQAEKATWLEGEVAGRDETIAAKDAALEEQARALAGQTEELAWRKGEQEALTEQVTELGERRAKLEALTAERTAEVAQLERRIAELLASLETSERAHSELEALLHKRLHEVAEVGRLALASQEHVMVRGLAPLFEALDLAAGYGEAPTRTTIEAGFSELLEAVQQGLARLSVLEQELAWRRAEMLGLSGEAARFPLRLFLGSTGLGKRARSWDAGTGGPA
ncbi:MAG: glycosyltransferase [Planctomycetota bacterium]|nr:glycosyltransferase [Planctomycetota bacterium]